MDKKTPEFHILTQFKASILRLFSFCILFLIWIGDSIIYSLVSIPRILLLIIRLIVKVIALIFSLFHRIIDNIIKWIKGIMISFPRFSRLRLNFKKVSKSQKNDQITKRPSIAKLRYFFTGVVLTLVLISFYQSFLFVKALPNPKLIGYINYPVSSKIFDRNGVLLYEDYNNQNRTPIKLNQIPDYMIKATIAVEDKEFYKHQGISLYGGILRALKEIITKKSLQGGSTITQQLIKTSLLTPERTIERKVKEAILAVWAEQIYTKDQILEMYFNQVPYGGTAYGIEEASQMYFGKHASELSLSEAAFLSGIPQAPTLYSPYTNPDLAIKRRNEALKNMLSLNYISQIEYDEAVSSSLHVQKPRMLIRAPHFVFYVKSQLARQYGIQKVEEGGLRIYTTLDISLQEKAEEILQTELAKVSHLNVTNGAILITNPKNGEILAMVGSRNYFEEPNGAFNVTTAKRQPGSSIKPIMYSLALEKGFTATSIIDDTPVAYSTAGSPVFRPVNYDGRYHGSVTLRLALANSYNIPAVRVLYQLGVSNFIEHASKMGISTWTDTNRYGLSLTLGGGEVTMTDMAVAFGTFANGGKKTPLNPIIRVENYQGDTLYITPSVSIQKQVISEESAYIISDILSDNIARRQAFGINSLLEIPGSKVAVKTGTTNDKRDNWTIGYTPQALVAVWVGNNDNSPMNRSLTSGVTGAAPIWNKVMKTVLSNTQPLWSEAPQSIIKKNCGGKIEYFNSNFKDKANCAKISIIPTQTP